MSLSSKDVDRTLAAIETLKSLDLVGTDYQEVCDAIKHTTRYLFASTCNLPTDFAIYRARVNQRGVLFRDATDISYPSDVKTITRFGRTHRPGRPVFYAATDPDTAVYEVSEFRKEDHGSVGEHQITVGRWSVRRPLPLVEFVHYPEALQRNPEVQSQHQHQDALLRSLGPDVYERADRILKYFSAEFAKAVTSPEEYKISCALYELFMEVGSWPQAEGDSGFVGALYPSVRRKFGGLNVSLEPRTVDAYLELQSVFVQRVRNDGTFISILPEKVAKQVGPDGGFPFEDVKEPIEVLITVDVY